MNIRRIYSQDLDRLHVRLTREQEHELACRAKRGDKRASDLLVCSILPLASHLAKLFEIRGVELMDLIQAGNEGAMIAVREFDPTLGRRLTTYAYFWIRSRILLFIGEHCATIRVPRGVLDGTNSRHLSDDELNELREWRASIESLDYKTKHDKTFRQMLIGSANTPLDLAIESENAGIQEELISRLPPRFGEVFRMRRDGKSFVEIGSHFGVSHQRAQQLLSKAIEKIQDSVPINNRKKVCS